MKSCWGTHSTIAQWCFRRERDIAMAQHGSWRPAQLSTTAVRITETIHVVQNIFHEVKTYRIMILEHNRSYHTQIELLLQRICTKTITVTLATSTNQRHKLLSLYLYIYLPTRGTYIYFILLFYDKLYFITRSTNMQWCEHHEIKITFQFDSSATTNVRFTAFTAFSLLIDKKYCRK